MQRRRLAISEHTRTRLGAVSGSRDKLRMSCYSEASFLTFSEDPHVQIEKVALPDVLVLTPARFKEPSIPDIMLRILQIARQHIDGFPTASPHNRGGIMPRP